MMMRNVGQASQFGDSSATNQSVSALDMSFGINYDSTMSDLQTQLLPQSAYGDTRWLCGDCGKHCQTKFALDLHRRTHTGEKPYGCDICDMRFNAKGNMKRHKLTHLSDQQF